MSKKKLIECEIYVERVEEVLVLPVVMRADLIAAGDQSGWNDLTYAAAAAAWGQAMDVPERMLNGTILLSPGSPVTDASSEYAANMSSPGAAISGFKMLRVIFWGPLDEKEAMKGAVLVLTTLVLYMTAWGFLYSVHQLKNY